MKTVFALVDCNNFFVSCERVFRPDSANTPAVVLSNNDGCVVARSNEIKALGVPMGAPFFKVKSLLEAHNTTVFSANFELYGDMSQRIVQYLEAAVPRTEVYSIDEAFLDISDVPLASHGAWARQLRADILQGVGVPVSIGVAPTKTLAKLASDYAKKHPEFEGAVSVTGEAPLLGKAHPRYSSVMETVLRASSVEDVWGVGRRYSVGLRRYGVTTAWELAQVGDEWARKQMTIQGLRMVKELRGQSCLPLLEGVYVDDHEQKSMSTTRTFGHTIRSAHQLESAVATFAVRVGAKLRRRKQIAGEITVYLQTGKHASQQFSPRITLQFPYPTADTTQIIKAALRGLRQIHDTEIGYKRAGVVLTGLRSRNEQQMPLQLGADTTGVSADYLESRKRVMEAVDSLNKRYGKGAVGYAVQGVKKQQWHSMRKSVTPAYTTKWTDVPVVRAYIEL